VVEDLGGVVGGVKVHGVEKDEEELVTEQAVELVVDPIRNNPGC